MFIEVIAYKADHVTFTDAYLNYIGNILQDKNLIVGEKVQIENIDNVERLKTYVIENKDWSGEEAIIGPAVQKAEKGDIIISYAQMNMENAKSFSPKSLSPNETINKLT